MSYPILCRPGPGRTHAQQREQHMASTQGRVLGTRLGGAMSLETGDKTPAADTYLTVWVCPDGHEFTVPFSLDAVRPDSWDCKVCGAPATDPRSDGTAVNPDTVTRMDIRGRATRPVKTHMDHVRERRTPAELEALLDEALRDLRTRVSRGEHPTRGITEYAS